MTSYDSNNYDAEKFNQAFVNALQDPDPSKFTKLAQVTNNWVQLRLRENAFCKVILKPMMISPKECQRDLTGKVLYFLEDVEPEHKAMSINFRGMPQTEYVTTERYRIDFHKLSSKRLQFSEEDLWVMKLPLFSILEQNMIKDIQEQEDQMFMYHVNSAIFQATTFRRNDLIDRGSLTGNKFFQDGGYLMNYLFTKTAAAWTGALAPGDLDRATSYESNIVLSEEEKFTRAVLEELANIPTYREMQGSVLLMHEGVYNHTLSWGPADAGYKIVEEIVVGGYQYKTFGKYTFVTTLRDNEYIVPTGAIYIFPEERFMGKFLILNKTKFYMEKKYNYVHMMAWEHVGAGFGNIMGIGLVVLKGKRVALPVQYQQTTGALITSAAGRGFQWVINDYEQATIPATVYPKGL